MLLGWRAGRDELDSALFTVDMYSHISFEQFRRQCFIFSPAPILLLQRDDITLDLNEALRLSL